MKIKQISIQGFKSFLERLEIDFPTGISGVVGPNGCGKSNVVDAIRWCMGEQSPKQLRGRKMEDVISAAPVTTNRLEWLKYRSFLKMEPATSHRLCPQPRNCPSPDVYTDPARVNTCSTMFRAG